MKLTSNKKRMKSATICALLAAMMMTAAACGDNKPEGSDPINNKPTQTDKLPESSGLLDTGVASSGDTQSEAEDGDSSATTNKLEVVEGEGIFSGIIDSHSIEVQTSEGYLSFQYAPELSETINSLEEDTKLKFSYTIQQLDDGSGLNQYTLTSIKPQ